MTLTGKPRGGYWLLAVLLALALQAAEPAPGALPRRILIANDTCPDVTWGFTEEQVRRSFADLIAAHLDEMNRTDAGPPESRDHYNVMAFVEVEAFLEQFPGRKDEFLRRAREGRICVSPFLCNTLWGFQSVEGVLRAFYPARRMERDHGIPLDVANHTELPSLPWGMATLLAGSGIRWVSVPFYDYDSTFKGLKNPPLFRFEGPDDSEVRVVMDSWAALKASYMQGNWLLQDPKRITAEWLPHYQQSGAAYPVGTIYASGTHSDINPNSWKQVRGFAEAIAQYNAAGTNPVTLVNGTLAQFCKQVDAAHAASPFLPTLRGCFGHSWELWPVSLANTVTALRNNERAFLAAESLVALASQAHPTLVTRTRADRESAEWCWAMLADHAWNGTDLTNRRHNAELRRGWADRLARQSRQLTVMAWSELGLKAKPNYVTVFNPLSFTNDVLVTCEAPGEAAGVRGLTSSLRTEDGQRQLLFVAPRVPPFGFREFRLETEHPPIAVVPPFSAGTNALEGPFYRLRVDPQSGGLASIVHKVSGHELVVRGTGRTLCQTVFFDGQERLLTGVECQARFDGASGELRVTGHIGDLRITNIITLYAALDRVDFDVRIEKPPTTNEQRLLQFFPVGEGAKDLRIETTAAVIRPAAQPEGDLLPGADTRRFAVQGFVDCSPSERVGVTIAPLDAYMLRLDQGSPAFEALGNDQNWKEVNQDQGGVQRFRFRYSLRAHAPGYDNAAAMAWSRSVTAPTTVAVGRLAGKWLDRSHLAVDPARALVTCWKLADAASVNQVLVRVWETSGASGPLTLTAPGFRQATETDLLERERGPLRLAQERISLKVRGHGFSAVKLQP
jgi:hypothetical protein